jgi:PIN domain nuclease of toxin-antitoxin system
VKLLLDTHVWIWSQNDPARLGPQTRRLLVAQQNENYVCAISTLELARLSAIGTISVSLPLRDWVERALDAIDARTVEISHAIALEAYAMPGSFHKDPADRLLVGAARCHSLTLLTADERILKYSKVRSRDARK